jgi:tetratricopeptide (TPR) repeat protein
MSKVLKNVKDLMYSAKDNRDFGDLEAGLDDLRQAIDLLIPFYQSAEDSDYKADLQKQIADCYGMMGGIYRRLASNEGSEKYLEEAVKMYSLGVEYEDKSNDSYNLSNSVVIPILIDPRNLEKQRVAIRDGLGIVQAQVAGRRKDQWWAWADLGLFKLLSGDREGALGAYSQFKRLGAREEDYESTTSVLSALWESLQKADSPVATSVASLVRDAIQLLQEM